MIMPRACLVSCLLLVGGCGAGAGAGHQDTTMMTDDAHAQARQEMVRQQIEARGVRDARVLDAMARVPRHLFVPDYLQSRAYDDTPLPIAAGQTISQPYIVAVMTELARVQPDDVVLEVGTGSGYQAAVLAHLARHVYSVEVVEELAREAAPLLARLGHDNVTVRHGDGYAGWPEHAPFDAIVVTAAPPEIPAALRKQLKVGGRLIVPVGVTDQELRVIERTDSGYRETSLMPVRFVPMVKGPRE